MERFNLKKRNYEVKGGHQVKILNKFGAFRILDGDKRI
jgi:hypothetical protein